MCNYESDTGRIIKKFDIYICDLGEMQQVSGAVLGKQRPCVILSSDNVNDHLQNWYKIAPIRTEHEFDVAKENAQEIVNERRKKGRLYVPITMGKDGVRFIDISQTTHVPSRDVLRYVSSITNERKKKEINANLAYTYFTKDELQDVLKDFDSYTSSTAIIDTSYTEEEKVESKPIEKLLSLQNNSGKNEISNIPNNFISLYSSMKRGVINEKAASARLGVSVTTFKKYVEEYENRSTKSQEDNKPIVIENKAKTNGSNKRSTLPSGFSVYYKKYKEGNMTVKEIAKRLNKHYTTIYSYIKKYESMQKELIS